MDENKYFQFLYPQRVIEQKKSVSDPPLRVTLA